MFILALRKTSASCLPRNLNNYILSVSEARFTNALITKSKHQCIDTARSTRPLTTADPASLLVYAGRSHDVKHVVVDGRVLVEDRELLVADLDEILGEAEVEARALRRRAGV